MNENDKATLTEFYGYILNNVVDVTDIVNSMRNLITLDMKQLILSEKTSRRQTSALLDLLPARGEQALDEFTRALRENGYAFVADKLVQERQKKSGVKVSPGGERGSMPSAAASRSLDDIALSASRLGEMTIHDPGDNPVWIKIRQCHNRIVEVMDPTPLLDYLYQDGVFTDEDVDYVRAERVRHEANRVLLKRLKTKSQERQQLFIDLLQKTQKYLSDEVRQVKVPVPATRTIPTTALASTRPSNVQPTDGTDTSMNLSRPSAGSRADVDDGEDEVDARVIENLRPADVVVKTCTKSFHAERVNDDYYPMSKRKRGRAYIFSVNYEACTLTSLESYNTVESDLLTTLLQQLHFEVTTYTDENGLTAQGIRDKIQGIQRELCQPGVQCLALFFLGHGTTLKSNVTTYDEAGIYGTDWKFLSKSELLEPLTDGGCSDPNIRGKPRLVFFNACRGPLAKPRSGNCPIFKDFVIGYATQAGYKAYGSYYIKAIVHVFMRHAHQDDIRTLLTKVNKRMVETYKDVPISEDSGSPTRTLFFFPGIEID